MYRSGSPEASSPLPWPCDVSAWPAPPRHHRAITEDRVIALDRPDGFGQLRTIDRFRQRLRLSDAGPDDDELLHVRRPPARNTVAVRSSAVSADSGLLPPRPAAGKAPSPARFTRPRSLMSREMVACVAEAAPAARRRRRNSSWLWSPSRSMRSGISLVVACRSRVASLLSSRPLGDRCGDKRCYYSSFTVDQDTRF